MKALIKVLNILHNTFIDLQGGKKGEYYHLTKEEHDNLGKSGGAHNDMEGLQGGGEGQYYHLTYAEYEHIPYTPVIVSPEDGAIGINQIPQIAGSTFAHVDNLPMFRRQMQVALDEDFEDIVIDTGEELSSSTIFEISLNPDNTPKLATGTVYYVRVRYQDRKEKWSLWSAPIHFETANEFPESILVTPKMLAPIDGGTLPSVDPVLVMSQPKVMAGTAIFDKADWQLSNDNTFQTFLYHAEGTPHTTMHATDNVDLATSSGLNFYARGRQGTTTGEYTPWSLPVHFSIKPDYDAPIFGLRRIFSNTFQQPFVYHIDEDGEIVHIRQNYFDNHPLYQFPKQDVYLGTTSTYYKFSSYGGYDINTGDDVYSSMRYVMPCWIKLHVYDDEEGSMVIDEWFSASDMSHHEGWILHPAFERSPHGILVGTTISQSISINGKSISTSIGEYRNGNDGSETNMTNLIAMDNTWHNFTIYERQLLCDLCVAESKSLIQSRLINLWHTAGWRGFIRLVRTENTSYEDTGQIINGFTWTHADGIVTQYQLTMPNFADNVLKLTPDNYPVAGNTVPTKVIRGYTDELGFDIALLGLFSNGEVSDGTLENKFTQAPLNSNSLFGMNNNYNKNLYGGCVNIRYSGMYGMIGMHDNYGRFYRVAKWIA